MDEYALIQEDSDIQIIRCNNCCQMIACICQLLAICCRDLQTIADIISCLAHCIFLATAGCMAAQIAVEKNHQIDLEKERPKGMSAGMVPPGQMVQHQPPPQPYAGQPAYQQPGGAAPPPPPQTYQQPYGQHQPPPPPPPSQQYPPPPPPQVASNAMQG